MRSRLDARPRGYAFVAVFALLRPPTSHTPQGVFSFFMRKRTFALSFAPSGAFSFFIYKRTFALSLAPPGAFSFVLAPRGAAACSIQNPHQRVTASSPECSRLGGETLGKSNKLIQNPERSEWVAEAGASRFPVNGRTGFPWSIRKTKSCPAGRTSLRRVFIRLLAHLSHAARRVFIFHAQTARLCFHSRPLARFHSFFAPRGAAACSIQNPHLRVTASSPECSRLGGETLGKSNKLIQNPERSEWVAEAGASRFPMNGRTGFPWSIRKTKSCPTGKDESLARFHSFAHLLTRRKACFHSSCANARLCFHSRPLARFHSFWPHAAQPRALFGTRTGG